MINERKLSKSELKKREDIIMKMKGNKRDLVKKYGKDAEAVMYGRATNMAKKKTENMRDPKITELIKDALRTPMKEANAFIVAADKARDAGKKEFEFPKGSGKMHKVTIKKDLKVDEDLESGQYGDPKVGNYDITSQNDNEASDIEALAAAGLEEDIDIGHEDNEPGMLQGDLYEIGKASMEIYAMLDDMEGQGEVDLPSWWQSKIYKAKEAIVGAAEYLDFELKEPAIDAVVDKVMPLDIDVDPLGETVEDYITSVDDLTEKKDMEKSKVAERILNKIKEGLPKGFFDKAMKAKDEIDEVGKGYFKKKFGIGKKGFSMDDRKEIDETIEEAYNKIQEGPYPFDQCVSDNEGKDGKEGAKKVCGAIRAAYGEGLVKEDYDSLVSKLKKQGKSAKAAKAIAGAMASYKAKGGGKGPTAKQKKRAK